MGRGEAESGWGWPRTHARAGHLPQPSILALRPYGLLEDVDAWRVAASTSFQRKGALRSYEPARASPQGPSLSTDLHPQASDLFVSVVSRPLRQHRLSMYQQRLSLSRQIIPPSSRKSVSQPSPRNSRSTGSVLSFAENHRLILGFSTVASIADSNP